LIAQGIQRGEYVLRRKERDDRSGALPEYASVAPGVHISLLVPAPSEDHWA
jgi:hypothetical protein